jgi:hypothetical protein
MNDDNERDYSWGEMFVGFLFLTVYCLVQVVWFAPIWLFGLLGGVVRGVRR